MSTESIPNEVLGPQKILKHGTKAHSLVLKALTARLDLSKRDRNHMDAKITEVDNIFRAYVKKTDKDKEREKKRKDGKPQYTTIVIPIAYALLMTAYTYWVSVFLGRDTVFQYTGRHGESKLKVKKLEALIHYQLHTGGNLPNLYSWFMDVGKYGEGIVGKYWDIEKINVCKYIKAGEDVAGPDQYVKEKHLVEGYQGHRIFNVHPKHFYPDTRVPLINFQKGEFCAHYFEEPWVIVETKELDKEYFNIPQIRKSLKSKAGGPTASSDSTESYSDMLDGDDPDQKHPDGTRVPQDDITEVGNLQAYEMTVELIPKKWGLGDGRRPEKWIFGFIPNVGIFKCRPLGTYANKFEYDLMTFEMNQYETSSRGIIELSQPFQEISDWLVNSHFFNVRKNLNSNIVYDPTKLDEKSLLSDKPGKRIKLKPAAYGQRISDFLFQFQEYDHTKDNLSQLDMIKGIAQWVFGLNDNLMGQIHPGGRKTATEIRTSSTMGINRQKVNAEVFSAHGFAELSKTLVQNTQQYYTGGLSFKITGNLSDVHNGEIGDVVEVSPEDISGFYDFVPVDGTLPIDRQAQAMIFKELLQSMRNLPPELSQKLDIEKMFLHTLSLAGAPEVEQFRLEVAPQADIDQGVVNGDLVEAPRDAEGRPVVNAGTGNMPV